ncbi:FAD-dependent oxidoreductase [Chelatococcus sambhunathii]|uniref:FAD-dependent oxidoreductase n=1 Tax=Chelatococcus sambhunathii TaxID=363953 RepID=A0ABU1DL13_9HYPH|nr:hydroxysqualene dehydroxylase HpnE [Chelatococcus sambhunathii]MDR4308828.1 FAD-dependent oxidoreductase [Chelatococcus sambhunathii]
MTKAVRIVGAGLAGLSAAVELAAAGYRVEIDEAAAGAGGRCRSYHDPQLGRVIDNGNHLVLSGNSAAMAYLDRIGAGGRLTGPDHAEFDFHDLRSGMRWRIAANDGPIPWWLLSPGRRTPGARLRDHLALARLMLAGTGARVGDVVRSDGPFWERLIEPIMVAALNVPAKDGSARLAGAVLTQSLARGGRASRPLIADPTLDAAFVAPALRFLSGRRAALRFGRRLRRIGFAGDRVAALDFGAGEEPVGDATVVLAVPPWTAVELVPGLIAPDRHSAIVNAHYACAAPKAARRMTGLLGGLAEWVFAFDDRLSVTISAADRLVEEDREVLARRIWADVAATLDLPPDALPRWQIVKEKRATFAATPEQDARRPPARTQWKNLALAGDWTQTGLPATIEGAIRSGVAAARLAKAAAGA